MLVLEQSESKVVAKVISLTRSPENCTAKSTLCVQPKVAVSKSVHELAEHAPPGRHSAVAEVTILLLPSNASNTQVWVVESSTPRPSLHAGSVKASKELSPKMAHRLVLFTSYPTVKFRTSTTAHCAPVNLRLDSASIRWHIYARRSPTSVTLGHPHDTERCAGGAVLGMRAPQVYLAEDGDAIAKHMLGETDGEVEKSHHH